MTGNTKYKLIIRDLDKLILQEREKVGAAKIGLQQHLKSYKMDEIKKTVAKKKQPSH
jgi:hypothetical protein